MNFIILFVYEKMSFFENVQQQWKVEIQPVIDDVYDCLYHMIHHGTKTDMFHQCQPIDLYTKIYELTSHHEFDFSHLDFLYQEELNIVFSFCSRFSIIELNDIQTHVPIFKILIQWCLCFFHHLNRLRDRTYHNLYTIRDQLMMCVRDSYFEIHKEVIISMLSSQWVSIRQNQYEYNSIVSETMKLIHEYHPSFYHDVLLFYFQHLRQYLIQEANQWSSQMSYMENTNKLFCHEQTMFTQYFHHHENDELAHVMTILRKVLVFPHFDMFVQHPEYGWKANLFSHKKNDIQTAYQFYSQCQFSQPNHYSLWLHLYGEFLKETIQSFGVGSIILSLNTFFQEQVNILQSIFHERSIQRQFTMTLEKSILYVFQKDPSIVPRLIKTLHNFLLKNKSRDILQQLSNLIQFSPEKDIFYHSYHYYFKIRLLSGKYHIENERFLLEILQTKFGTSFVLNLLLMLDEVQHCCLSNKQYSVYKLSHVVWNMENSSQLTYRLPSCVEIVFNKLSRKWQEKNTHESIRLQPLVLQGMVTISFQEYEFIMSPIQAIVLLALETPANRQQLVLRLHITDDEIHNLDGILETLSQSNLIRCSEETWHQVHGSWHKPKTVFVSPVKKKHRSEQSEIHPAVLEAWIVKTMKHHQHMLFSVLFENMKQSYPIMTMTQFRTIINHLTDREFLCQEKDNVVSYVP